MKNDPLKEKVLDIASITSEILEEIFFDKDGFTNSTLGEIIGYSLEGMHMGFYSLLQHLKKNAPNKEAQEKIEGISEIYKEKFFAFNRELITALRTNLK